jgi:hypothetical protein
MAKSIVQINTAADNFQTLYTRVNEVINAISTEVVTANTNANGSLTTGNAFVNGIFGANTFTVVTGLRGGNVQSAGQLPIISNVYVSGEKLVIGNSTVNATINSIGINYGTLIANQTHIIIGNSTVNTVINSSSITVTTVYTTNTVNVTLIAIGNSTVNVNINSVAAVFGGNVIANQTHLAIGNSTVNTVMNSSVLSISGSTVNSFINATALVIQNSTVQFVLSKPTAAQVTSGNYYLNANGSYTQIAQESTGWTNTSTTTTGTSAHLIDSFDLTVYRTVDYTASIKNNSANGYQCQKMLCLNTDGDVDMTEFSIMYSNGVLGTFVANSNSTFGRLWFIPTPANTTVKLYMLKVPV